MDLFTKKYKISLLIRNIYYFVFCITLSTFVILLIVFSALGYESEVVFSFVGVIAAIVVPFIIFFWVPNFYPPKLKWLKIFLSYRIYILKHEKTIKKYRSNYIWSKRLELWDEELETFDNDVVAWFNSWNKSHSHKKHD